MCTRKLISIQPRSIYYLNHYPDQEATDLLDEVAEYGIMFHRVNGKEVHHWGFRQYRKGVKKP
jgi:hypothetical protein